MDNCKEDNYTTEDKKFIDMLKKTTKTPKDNKDNKSKKIYNVYESYKTDLENDFSYEAFSTDFNQQPTKKPFDIRSFAADINLEIKEEWLDIATSGQLENNIITVNTIEADYRQNFTIAHEIGHYILDHGNITEYRRSAKIYYNKEQLKQEEDADFVAANLLLPSSIINKVVSKFKDQLKIQKLSDNRYSTKVELVAKLQYVLDVSEQAVIKRLKELKHLEPYVWL
jgi:hypothetical protein